VERFIRTPEIVDMISHNKAAIESKGQAFYARINCSFRRHFAAIGCTVSNPLRLGMLHCDPLSLVYGVRVLGVFHSAAHISICICITADSHLQTLLQCLAFSAA